MRIRISPELRRTIQVSAESVRTLARRYHMSPGTVQKWRKRSSTTELQRGPKPGHCRAVAHHTEKSLVLFRQQTQLPLDDCLYALRVGTPGLSRATLYRYFRKYGLGSVATSDGYRSFRACAGEQIGYVHIGLMRIRVRAGHIVLLNGFDRISKFAFGFIEESLSAAIAGAFVHEIADIAPFQINTVQTSNEPPFVGSAEFARACAERKIAHRVVAAIRPDPMKLAERAADSPQDAAIDFETIEEVRGYLAQQLKIYNHTCRLKALRGLTPMEYATQYVQRNSRGI